MEVEDGGEVSQEDPLQLLTLCREEVGCGGRRWGRSESRRPSATTADSSMSSRGRISHSRILTIEYTSDHQVYCRSNLKNVFSAKFFFNPSRKIEKFAK